MSDAMTALIQAVRDELRATLSLNDSQCDIEMDDQVPANVGDLYLTVIPGDVSAGPRHRSSGGVKDKIYAVDVDIILRATAIPRDRRRSLITENLVGLNALAERVENAIDFVYGVNTRAATYLPTSEAGFVEPLSFLSKGRPREVSTDVFAAVPGKHAAGIGCTVCFGLARRMVAR